ncbi:MAG: hypothetical protein JWQ78_1641, partial [Sediminibacterium sp.]|nr:hypothetical protein [Sediminibacterium sp.]
MSRFIAQADPKKVRNERRYQVFALLGTVILAGGLVYYASDENDRFIPKVVIFLYLVSLLTNWLRMKRREFFIEVTNDRIAWRLTEPENKTVLSWKEIRWIKRETNDGITIFQDSSFSSH